jgi:D-alanyl-D-alanine carboxypeptidase
MKNFLNEKRIIINYILFIFLGIIFSTIFFKLIELDNFNKKVLEEKKNIENSLKNKKIEEENKIAKEKIMEEAFGSLDIKAKSFLIYDLEKNEEIFSLNKNKKLGIASLTKIASADIFLESLKNSSEYLSEIPEQQSKGQAQKVQVVLKNLNEEGNNGIYNGEIFRYLDVLNFMMIVSSNDIASALTNKIGKEKFILEMNRLAEKLNMNSTLFFSESGLDVNKNVAGSYSSSSDILKLVKYFYKKYPEISKNFSVDKKRICSDLKCHDLENTNILLSEKENFPYKVLFSKTGYTKKTGGSLSMVLEILNKNFLIVLLSSGKNERFVDMKNLSNAVEKFLKSS